MFCLIIFVVRGVLSNYLTISIFFKGIIWVIENNEN